MYVDCVCVCVCNMCVYMCVYMYTRTHNMYVFIHYACVYTGMVGSAVTKGVTKVVGVMHVSVSTASEYILGKPLRMVRNINKKYQTKWQMLFVTMV